MLLDEELENLNIMLVKMADLVNHNINEALEMYNDNKEIYINDDIIDQYERLIEEICLNIMLKERPYAKDLRKVSGILKLVADLERIGDHAEDIMEFNVKMRNIERIEIDELKDMTSTTLSMVKKSIESFVNKDKELALEVISTDDIVDKYYSDLVEYLINESANGKITTKFAIYSTLVVKYIERIADHAVNIAEWVIYIESGFHKDKQIF